jgi:hypothetical protein
MLCRVIWQKLTYDSEVLTASIIRAIALMMEAVRTSETSVSFYQTARRNIPEDSHLHHVPSRSLVAPYQIFFQ